jgi:hypothetical protein
MISGDLWLCQFGLHWDPFLVGPLAAPGARRVMPCIVRVDLRAAVSAVRHSGAGGRGVWLLRAGVLVPLHARVHQVKESARRSSVLPPPPSPLNERVADMACPCAGGGVCWAKHSGFQLQPGCVRDGARRGAFVIERGRQRPVLTGRNQFPHTAVASPAEHTNCSCTTTEKPEEDESSASDSHSPPELLRT